MKGGKFPSNKLLGNNHEGSKMYNLLVSSHEDSWNGEPYHYDQDRCVREYTDKNIYERFGLFTPDQVNQITRMPCIFAYETFLSKNPKFGSITNITCRQGKVRVEYVIHDLPNFLTYSNLAEMGFELDLWQWELNRTHWAIKNVNLPKELHSRGVNLPNWALGESRSVDISTHIFDVAFSFPGEVRGYVESVAVALEREIGPNTYFYDNNYIAQLARPSLNILLQQIYRYRSKLVVVFLCEAYQEKEWCGVEFRAIQEIIMNKDLQRVMFVKMDNGNVDGVFKTDGYIDGRNHSPQTVAGYIRERVSLLT